MVKLTELFRGKAQLSLAIICADREKYKKVNYHMLLPNYLTTVECKINEHNANAGRFCVNLETAKNERTGVLTNILHWHAWK